MEACNDRYFFVPRLFGIGPRSSKPRPRPKLSSFTIQRWRLFRAQRPATATATSAPHGAVHTQLERGRFRFLAADHHHDQSTRRRQPGGIHARALLAIQLQGNSARNHYSPMEASAHDAILKCLAGVVRQFVADEKDIALGGLASKHINESGIGAAGIIKTGQVRIGLQS